METSPRSMRPNRPTMTAAFSVIPTEVGRLFPAHGFCAPAHVAEGPWQHGNFTEINETKPTNHDRRLLCHPDRSGPAFSCARFLCAGPRSGGTLATWNL